MAGRAVRMSFVADTKELQAAVGKAERALAGVGDAADRSGTRIDSAFTGVADSSDKVASASAQAAGGVGDIAGALEATGLIGEGTATAMNTAAQGIMGLTGAADIANLVTDKMKTSLIATKVATVAQTVATNAATVATKAFNLVMRMNPIGLIITALLLLAAAIPLVVKHWDSIKAAMSAVWSFISGVFSAAWNTLKTVISTVVNGIKSVITSVFDTIKGYFTLVFAFYKSLFSSAWNGLKSVLEGPVRAIKALVSSVFDGIKLYFTTIFNVYKSVFTKAWDVIKSVTTGAFRGIKDKIVGPIGDVVDYIKGVPGKVLGLVGKFKDAGSRIMSGLIDGIKNAAGMIGDIAGSIWGALKGFINTQLIDRVNSYLDFSINILGKDVRINPPNIPHLANGGITSGPMLAMIGDNRSGKEAVIPLERFDEIFGRTGGNYYHIEVKAGPASDPVAIGREVSRVLEAYERAGGKKRAA